MGSVVDCGRLRPVVKVCQDVVEDTVEVDVVMVELDNRAETEDERSF